MVKAKLTILKALAFGLLLALGLGQAKAEDQPAAQEQSFSKNQPANEPSFANSKVRLAVLNGDGGYRLTRNAGYADIRRKMMKRQVLEEYAKFLSPMKLPKTLWIYAEECEGGPGASPHYNTGSRAMVMCYQFMKMVDDRASALVQYQAAHPDAFPWRVTRDGFIAGVFAGVVLHETGHAMFDILEVPVFGREEDAADELSTFVALQFSRPLAEVVVASYSDLAASFSNPPDTPPDTASPNYPKDPAARCFVDPFCAWADEHGAWGQRFYNTLCLTYGASPGDHAFLTQWLPANRDCASEYKRIYDAFAKTIYPFIDQRQRTVVQSHAWFRANELMYK